MLLLRLSRRNPGRILLLSLMRPGPSCLWWRISNWRPSSRRFWRWLSDSIWLRVWRLSYRICYWLLYWLLKRLLTWISSYWRLWSILIWWSVHWWNSWLSFLATLRFLFLFCEYRFLSSMRILLFLLFLFPGQPGFLYSYCFYFEWEKWFISISNKLIIFSEPGIKYPFL